VDRPSRRDRALTGYVQVGIGFAHADVLWLLAAMAVVAIALRRRGRTHGGAQAPLRAAAAGLIVVALAQPSLSLRTASLSIAYVVDVSRSMSAESLAQAIDWIGRADRQEAPSTAHYLAFGSGVRAFDSLEALQEVRVGGDRADLEGGIDDRGTALEHALDAARSLLGEERDRRIVVFTDGNQTRGDALRALSRLRAHGVRVFVVPAVVASEPRAWIEELSFLSPVRMGEPAVLSVRAVASVADMADVEVTVDGAPLAKQAVRLQAGSNEWTRQVRFARAGSATVEVKLSIAGGAGTPDVASAFVQVKPAVRVLYLERVHEDARFLARALREQGMRVFVAGLQNLGNLGALTAYDAVILSDAPAHAVEHTLGARLERYVRDGGGLVFAAGESAHGQGGYADTRIESILPVRFRDRRKRDELDLVLLVDRSSSMQGPKLGFAKAAAVELLDAVERDSRLGVIAFSGRPREVVPLQRHADRAGVVASIAAMSAGGQTDIFSALWHVRGMLRSSRSALKHVILLSDGDTVPVGMTHGDASASSPSAMPPGQDQARPEDFRALTRLLAREGVSVSTVAVGEAAEIEFMRNIAEWTGGASHVARSESEIPALILADARRFTSDSIVERPFRASLRWRPAALDGIDFASAPPLLGLVVAQPKTHAEVLLDGIDERPLLVRSHYGLGRSIAFLSDVKQRWAAQWLGWSGYGRFWAQVVRSAAQDRPERSSWHIARESGGARIVLTVLAADGSLANGLQPQARITDPHARVRTVMLDQAGPGRYEAFLAPEVSRPGAYRIDLANLDGAASSAQTMPGPLSLNVPQVQDRRFLAANVALLEALATGTGGKLSPTPQEVFAARDSRGLLRLRLWPVFAGAALACVLGDLLLRRRVRRRTFVTLGRT